jgi:transposase
VTKCTVCNHPDRNQIDLDLIHEMSVRKVAAKYGLHYVAVQKHKMPPNGKQSHIQKHLLQADKKATKKLADKIEEIYNKSFELAEMAVKLKDPKGAAYCLTNAVKVIDVLSKGAETKPYSVEDDGLMADMEIKGTEAWKDAQDISVQVEAPESQTMADNDLVGCHKPNQRL